MSQNTENLQKWLAKRNIDSPMKEFESAIESEVDEYTEAMIESDEHEIVDACADMIVLAKNQLILKGYNPDKVLAETIKEISSRVQDPEQASRDWSHEKWAKDKNQDPDTMYKADYTDCKL